MQALRLTNKQIERKQKLVQWFTSSQAFHPQTQKPLTRNTGIDCQNLLPECVNPVSAMEVA